jgi:glycosyltransferase involved in cell wall biosynthesis
VDSALGQSYPAIEVLIVNDGSDDDTEAVARGYGDRVRYVYRPNGGLSAARNSGIAQARGAYFKFLDADDSLHPDQIAWQMAALAGRPNCVSLTGVRLYRDRCPEQFLDHLPTAKALLPDLFRDIDWGGIHGFLFPAGLVRAVGGFDATLRFAEDWNFFCRVGLHGPLLLTDPRIGAYYRLRAGSMSTNRVGMTTTRAGLLIELHDLLQAASRPDWFGLDLLKLEQATYHGLVLQGVRDPRLLDGLLTRIHELQRREGFGLFGWRFRLLARLLGYARAERVRAHILRITRKKPPEALDTGAWRESA